MNEEDYVDLALTCANICTALDRGLREKQLNELSISVCEAIKELTVYVELGCGQLVIATHNLPIGRQDGYGYPEKYHQEG